MLRILKFALMASLHTQRGLFVTEYQLPHHQKMPKSPGANIFLGGLP